MAKWPRLRVDDWTDTRETLHMWLQIVGKLEMVMTPLINHWWNVTYSVSARGLRTRLMRSGNVTLDAEFDFVDHILVFRDVNGTSATIELAPKSVAEFWRETEDSLAHLGVDVQIVSRPNEVSPAIPFAEDTEHHSYDAKAANLFWRQLLVADNVFTQWRAGFIGKDSPVQLFWGSMDLSCVRFSGRGAPPHTSNPPNCPHWVMAEAESRENAAAGFWPGGGAEGAFYAYAYPEPAGYREATVTPGAYDATLGEYLLTYEDAADDADPDAAVMSFLNTTYAAAADLGHWDRAALDVNPHRLDKEIYRRA